jgi:hypothetical protein
MDKFEVLGAQSLNEVTLNCKELLEDMGSVNKRVYPTHATAVGEIGTS